MRKLLLIDGNNLMFRAYHATAAMGNLMQNSKGVYTNMVYGFTNMIMPFLAKDYSHILVAFDKGKKTKRHQEFTEYKALRKETPQELISQIPLIHKLLEVLDIKFLSLDEFEADDILGSASRCFKDDFDEIDLVSNDFDLMQLIDEKTFKKLGLHITSEPKRQTKSLYQA